MFSFFFLGFGFGFWIGLAGRLLGCLVNSLASWLLEAIIRVTPSSLLSCWVSSWKTSEMCWSLCLSPGEAGGDRQTDGGLVCRRSTPGKWNMSKWFKMTKVHRKLYGFISGIWRDSFFPWNYAVSASGEEGATGVPHVQRVFLPPLGPEPMEDTEATVLGGGYSSCMQLLSFDWIAAQYLCMHFLTGLLICQPSCTHETTDIPESWAVGSIPNTPRLLSSWNRQSFVYLIYSYLLLSRHIIEPPLYRSSARIVISHMGFSGKENENAVPRFWLDLHGLFWRGLDCWDGLFNTQNSHQNAVGFRGWLLSLPG